MKLIGVLFFILFSLNTFAIDYDISLKNDTNKRYNIAKSKYKLSKKEFLSIYGTNDTIVEIINLYFRKRNIAFINPEFLGTLTVLGAAFSYDKSICSQSERDCIPIHIILSIPLVYASAIFCSIRSPINLMKYSRLNLYMEIQTFLKTGETKRGTWRKISRRLN